MEIVLEDPKKKLEETPPRPKIPRNGDDEVALVASELRNKLALNLFCRKIKNQWLLEGQKKDTVSINL